MSKPRFLIISPYIFYPPNSGGTILIYNHAKALSKFYDLEILVTRARADCDDEWRKGLASFGKVYDIETPSNRMQGREGSLAYMLQNYPRAVFSKYPVIDIYYFYSNPKVQELIQDDFQYIQLNHAWFYHSALKNRRGKLILMQHNWEYEYWRQMVGALFSKKEYFRAMCYWLGGGKIREQEREAVTDADFVVALSERERKIFQEIYHKENNCVAINPGIDIISYESPLSEDKPSDCREIKLIYVGSLETPQHSDGIIQFIRTVYPTLKRKSNHKYSLSVVGARPPKHLQDLARQDPSITLTGYVDDVKFFIKQADIYLVPLLNSSGIRFKIMEAMAMGKVIVSTKKGAEGLDIAGTGVMVCDTLEDFTSTIEQVAGQGDREELGEKNRKFAQEHFDCEKIFMEKFLPFYQKL